MLADGITKTLIAAVAASKLGIDAKHVSVKGSPEGELVDRGVVQMWRAKRVRLAVEIDGRDTPGEIVANVILEAFNDGEIELTVDPLGLDGQEDSADFASPWRKERISFLLEREYRI